MWVDSPVRKPVGEEEEKQESFMDFTTNFQKEQNLMSQIIEDLGK